MPPKKGKKKPLTPEEQEEVELCWYKYDQQSREFMDIAEFKSLWMNLKADAFDDEETKAMFEKWDADKEKKARYPVFIKELEAEIQAIADPAVREETLGRLADGPQGSTNDYVAKHDLSPEEGVALRGLEGLKCLLKVDDLEELKASKNPAAGIAEVCYGAMCLLANPGDEIVWRECQMWLKDPEGTYFKMFSFFKRVNIGHVDDRRIERCRQFILQQRDWFDHSVISEVDKTAGLIAMWTLLAVRYFDAVDAYKMLPVLPAGEKPEECGDADKVFSTVMPIRTALPKAEEAYLAGRLVVLVDPKGMTKQHFLATNACILDAKDASQLRRKHVREMLVDCVQKRLGECRMGCMRRCSMAQFVIRPTSRVLPATRRHSRRLLGSRFM
eukprot:TRINITY_DN3019_c0_g1_i4.p1 TRINITY_DN3019_c0_g1~~TRINITY_DN3019_c0_g1_i4.p1  ORF type:complete len:386 (+),score=103.44 TRINITY_DN3019_c0_g1_i4:199-1356(+)